MAKDIHGFQNGSKAAIFCENYLFNNNGTTGWVYIVDMPEKLQKGFGNGGSWTRKSSSLAKRFTIEPKRANENATKGKIVAIRLTGYNPDAKQSQDINRDIRDIYEEKPCVFIGAVCAEMEIDHKDGQKSDPRVMNTATQEVSDFQPTSKTANVVKRQKCKVCIETDKRYDAMDVGFSVPWFRGNESLSDSGCDGCYLHDPLIFRLKVSASYEIPDFIPSTKTKTPKIEIAEEDKPIDLWGKMA